MIQNHFCFDLLSMRQRGFRLYEEMFSKVLKEYDLTQMEMDILLFLANNPEYDTASQIVSIRRLTKSHVSVSVEQLVQKGFLMRTYENGNSKVIHLRIEEEAQKVIASGRQCQKSFADLISEGISAEKLCIAEEVLKQMFDNVKHYEKKKEKQEKKL